MRFVFRADASREIGAGHVSRSCVIASELISRGFQTIFIGQIHEIKWLEKSLPNLGFTQVYSNCKDFSSSAKEDVLILDSYTIPLSDSFIHPSKWFSIVNIFDQATPNYQSDMKIHPGIETVDHPTSEWNLAGKEFFLVRKSMSNYNPPNEDSKLRITVVGGGTDTLDFSQVVSSILKDIKTDFVVQLLVSKKTYKFNDERFNVIEQGEIIDVLSRDSDLVLTTASTTALEFISTGCAVGIAQAVDNQRRNYNMLVELGVAYPIGYYSNNVWNLDFTNISKLVTDSTLRINLRNNARNWLDKDGQKRVVDAILSYVERKSKGSFQ